MLPANTEAVVVPSPAFSLVLLATSYRSLAPIFSYLLSSSISLAIDTPSLVIIGEPYPLSKATFRPFGPSVILTVSTSVLTPFSISVLASFAYLISFAMIVPPT